MIHYLEFDFDTLPDLEYKISKKCAYLNADFGVDIETTSFYHDGEKYAYPYIFMINMCGKYIYCRYIEELAEIFQHLKQRYSLNNRRRILMFIHNQSFEFQFFRDICDFDEVFARTPLKPLKSLDKKSFIEFRCSYVLSGLSLEKLAMKLKTKTEKISGEEFNYKKIRHSETPLNELELKYCERDVEILHHYICEEIERNEGDITKIPLTRTGYVRRECRNRIFNEVNRSRYRYMIYRDSPDLDLFTLLHKAFAGGDTHANYLHVRQNIKNVSSFDFSSSYPAVMVKCKFPYKFVKTVVGNRETFENLINKKACIFKCMFKHIKAKRHHHTLSYSKCETITNFKLDNGRVVEGDYVTCYFTEIDYKDFIQVYDVGKHGEMKIIEFYYSNYNYLPTPFVKYILELYQNKCTLKGLNDELNKALYQLSKEYINGLYGMTVTAIVNPEIKFGWHNDEETQENIFGWYKENPNTAEVLEKYRNKYSSFLLYQWGVWVTAWARHFLHETIMKIEDNTKIFDDFVYCDTDSIKICNVDKHMKTIEEYNKQNIEDMKTAMNYHGFDENAFIADSPEDGIQVLGAWKNETLDKNGNQAPYKIFKTLGAKRYMYYDDNDPFVLSKNKETGEKITTPYHLTVSGLNKYKAIPYIIEHGDFDFFNHNMCIPPEYTGKLTHTYISKEYDFMLVDYLGIESRVHQTHYVHLEEQEYNLKLNDKYIEYLNEYVCGVNENGQPYDNEDNQLRIRF